MKYTYLLINLFSIIIPLCYSWDKRMTFARKWPAFFAANFLVAIPFIIWDGWFTRMGVWGFNERYLLGVYSFDLPLEEWLFFLCIPYACVFTHESLKYFFSELKMKDSFRNIYLLLGIISVMLAVKHSDKWYTVVTASLVVVFAGFLWLRGSQELVVRLFISYVVIILPFLIVNGLLTGWCIPEQVVWYNDEENMGIRVGSIPMDDFFYCFLLIGANIVLYEYFLKIFGIPRSLIP